MKNTFHQSALYLFLFSLITTGCGDIIPLWVDETELNDFTLYYTDKPVEFHIEIDQLTTESTQARLELDITYYTDIGRTDIPLFLSLEDDSNHVSEFNANVLLKAEGEWLGVPHNNEIDYTITHNVISSLELRNGHYLLRIYANDEKKEKIYGVVRIVARLYEIETLSES